MPDKHEVGGSTPLEPTSRQCRQPVVRITARNRSKADRRYNDLRMKYSFVSQTKNVH